jgi:hypothetical protein
MIKNNFTKLMLVTLFILLLASCSPKYPLEITDIQLPTKTIGTQNNDIEVIVTQSDQIIRKYLPNAHFAHFSLNTTSHDLLKLAGQITIVYVQIDDSIFLPRPKTLYGIAQIDTQKESITIKIKDVTDNYPNLEFEQVPSNSQFREIAQITNSYIAQYDKDCNVNIFKVGNTWNVICSKTDNSQDEIRFGIDADTLSIVEYKAPK